MKRQRYSEEQIIGILKEAEAGVPLADLVRKHGISSASFYAVSLERAASPSASASCMKRCEDVWQWGWV